MKKIPTLFERRFENHKVVEVLRDVMERHGLREVVVIRTFDGVKWWLNNFYQEGLVFWLNGEPICKIKRSDFGLEWGGRKK